MTPEAAFRLYYPQLVDFARSWGCDDPEAIVQDAFAQFVHKGTHVPERFVRAWLYTTTRRLCHHRRRARQREAPLFPHHSHSPGLSDEARTDYAFEQLVGEGPACDLDRLIDARDAIADLLPARRLCLLAVAAGFSYTELQERENVDFHWVNRQVYRGRRQLRRRVAA